MTTKLSASEKLSLAKSEAERAGLFVYGRGGRFMVVRRGVGVIGIRSSEEGVLRLVRRAMRSAA